MVSKRITEKVCLGCSRLLSREEFGEDSLGRMNRACPECRQQAKAVTWRHKHPLRHKEQQHKYYVANKDKHYKTQRKNHLRRKFGLTEEEYVTLLIQQDHRCAICGVHQDDHYKLLSVDHDHKTGLTRGLLCQNCNGGIGQLQDSAELLRKAADYLEEYTS